MAVLYKFPRGKLVVKGLNFLDHSENVTVIILIEDSAIFDTSLKSLVKNQTFVFPSRKREQSSFMDLLIHLFFNLSFVIAKSTPI